jgi:hypothetical protein
MIDPVQLLTNKTDEELLALYKELLNKQPQALIYRTIRLDIIELLEKRGAAADAIVKDLKNAKDA